MGTMMNDLAKACHTAIDYIKMDTNPSRRQERFDVLLNLGRVLEKHKQFRQGTEPQSEQIRSAGECVGELQIDIKEPQENERN